MRRDHRRRNIRATTRRRFCPEQVIVFVIDQFGRGKLSGYSVRTVGTERWGCSSINGGKADRPLPLWPNTLRDAAKMRRRFWRKKIAAQARDSPAQQRAGFPAAWARIVVDAARRPARRDNFRASSGTGSPALRFALRNG
jgi:hypothetical protein